VVGVDADPLAASCGGVTFGVGAAAEVAEVDVVPVASVVDPARFVLVGVDEEAGASVAGGVTVPTPGGTGAGAVVGGVVGAELGAVVVGLDTGLGDPVVGVTGTEGPDVGCVVVEPGVVVGVGDGVGSGVVVLGTGSANRKACPLLSTAAHEPAGEHDTAFRWPSRSRRVGADQADPS
jgi:hypothetical protein